MSQPCVSLCSADVQLLNRVIILRDRDINASCSWKSAFLSARERRVRGSTGHKHLVPFIQLWGAGLSPEDEVYKGDEVDDQLHDADDLLPRYLPEHLRHIHLHNHTPCAYDTFSLGQKSLCSVRLLDCLRRSHKHCQHSDPAWLQEDIFTQIRHACAMVS